MLMGRLLLKRNTKILASIPRKVKMSIHYVIINTSIFFLLKLAILVKLKVSECFSFFFKALYRCVHLFHIFVDKTSHYLSKDISPQ